jgi:hypothetical protein
MYFIKSLPPILYINCIIIMIASSQFSEPTRKLIRSLNLVTVSLNIVLVALLGHIGYAFELVSPMWIFWGAVIYYIVHLLIGLIGLFLTAIRYMMKSPAQFEKICEELNGKEVPTLFGKTKFNFKKTGK